MSVCGLLLCCRGLWSRLQLLFPALPEPVSGEAALCGKVQVMAVHVCWVVVPWRKDQHAGLLLVN
jgi:hypothetical protein